MQRSNRLFGVSLLILVLLGMWGISRSFNAFVSGYEGQDTRLVSYDASNYDPDRGTPKELDDTRAFIDPDGPIVYGVLTPKAGQITGLQVELSEPVPINYINGRYSQVYSNSQWKPTEEWTVNINGVDHEICVFRMVFGLTITTATSRPDKGLDEDRAIQNLQINVRVNLPTWKGVEDAFVGLGNIRIPKTTEVEGTAWDPPVDTQLIGLDWRSPWARLLGLDVQFNEDPYIGPYSPGVFLHGTDVVSGTNPLSAPKAVTVPFEWSAIKPGIQDVGILAEQRVEVSEALTVIITFMAARPLYVAADEGGIETAVGGVLQPPLQCGLVEDPVYNSAGEVIACVPKDIWGDIYRLVFIVLILLVGCFFMFLIVRSFIIAKVTN